MMTQMLMDFVLLTGASSLCTDDGWAIAPVIKQAQRGVESSELDDAIIIDGLFNFKIVKLKNVF